jgi:hypothetical protein
MPSSARSPNLAQRRKKDVCLHEIREPSRLAPLTVEQDHGRQALDGQGFQLSALGVSAAPLQAARDDGAGFGCHLFGRDAYWLESPSFDPAVSDASVRIVCGCVN